MTPTSRPQCHVDPGDCLDDICVATDRCLADGHWGAHTFGDEEADTLDLTRDDLEQMLAHGMPADLSRDPVRWTETPGE